MREQAQIAMDAADVIVFVTEIATGVTAADRKWRICCCASKKPVVLCVNKMDATGLPDPGFYEFYSRLGGPHRARRSTATARATCWTSAWAHFPPEEEGEERTTDKGRRHRQAQRGQELLINLILGEKRVIVPMSPVRRGTL